MKDYAELVVQYGFVTLFVVAFPLVPALALFNNFFERCESVLSTQVPAASMASYRRLYTVSRTHRPPALVARACA